VLADVWFAKDVAPQRANVAALATLGDLRRHPPPSCWPTQPRRHPPPHRWHPRRKPAARRGRCARRWTTSPPPCPGCRPGPGRPGHTRKKRQRSGPYRRLAGALIALHCPRWNQIYLCWNEMHVISSTFKNRKTLSSPMN